MSELQLFANLFFSVLGGKNQMDADSDVGHSVHLFVGLKPCIGVAY
jgi:hypothetical protein